jgi:hypothetical protein
MPSGTVPAGALNLSYSLMIKHGNSRSLGNGGFISAGTAARNRSNSWRFSGNIGRYHNYWYSNDFTHGNNATTIPAVAAVTYNGSTLTQKGYRDAVLTTTATNRTGGNTAVAVQKIGVTVANEFLKGEMYALLIFSSELPQSDITLLDNTKL